MSKGGYYLGQPSGGYPISETIPDYGNPEIVQVSKTRLVAQAINLRLEHKGEFHMQQASGELALSQSTIDQVNHYIDKAIDCIADSQVAPDYAKALEALEQNPLLNHPDWRAQLQLSQKSRQAVLDYFDFLSAEQVAQTLYPHWSAEKPVQAIHKQHQRGALLALDSAKGKLFPAQQFDLFASSPSVHAQLKPLLKLAKTQSLTNLEVLHWLCAPVTLDLVDAKNQINEATTPEQIEAALELLAQKGPTKTLQLAPIEIADKALFNQVLAQWLGHTESLWQINTVNTQSIPEQRQQAINTYVGAKARSSRPAIKKK